jgi:hemerythrin-like domain-containing protein
MANLDEEPGLRLQAEHKALVQLSQMVRGHIAAMPGLNVAAWLEGLRVAFDRLHAHIERCIQMKEKDGYLRVIVREHPALARQIEAVQNEHGQVLRLGDGIRNDLATARPEDRLLVSDLCARVQRFMAVVDQHEQRENMIVLFACNQDFGAF